MWITTTNTNKLSSRFIVTKYTGKKNLLNSFNWFRNRRKRKKVKGVYTNRNNIRL